MAELVQIPTRVQINRNPIRTELVFYFQGVLM